jgi:hypothetical protein
MRREKPRILPILEYTANLNIQRYLPSAAAARRKLLVETAAVEDEMAQHSKESDIRWHKKWGDIYSYSYNESLTGCVAQLEELEKFTKLIVGEQG